MQKVYEAISNVMHDISKEGITKDRKNQQQGYSFRGIDDVFNALSPILAKNKLCILPRVMSRETVERATRNGVALFYTTLLVEFDFVSAEDGSKHTVCMVGEAMDSADKSSNKAMSAAYKYAAMQAFCIPTEGDNDADGTTHDVAPRSTHQKSTETKSATISMDEARSAYKALSDDMKMCKRAGDLARWWKDEECVKLRAKLPDNWAKSLRSEWEALGKSLREAETKLDVVNEIEDAFPGSATIDERVRNHPLVAGE
jgi:hypothetical protein